MGPEIDSWPVPRGARQTEPAMSREEHVVLRRPSRSTFILIGVGVAMALLGLELVREGYGATGWGIVVMFGAMAVIAGITVMPGSTQLELDASGFWTTTLFQKGEPIRWEEVAGFETAEVGGKRRAGFRLTDASKPVADRDGAPRPAGGLDGVFTRDYGLKPEELAETLNEWRSRHL